MPFNAGTSSRRDDHQPQNAAPVQSQHERVVYGENEFKKRAKAASRTGNSDWKFILDYFQTVSDQEAA
jgi:hypothetical protein